MESEQFDTLTRRLSGTGSSRRHTLRTLGAMLFASTLTGVAVRLGLADVMEAKPKHKKAKSAHKRHRPDERNEHGRVEAQGKGKKKKHKKPKPQPLPPECQHCNDCQMCQDGACYRDPALEGVRCLGSGSNCGYCQGGFCTATDRQPCEDGVCPRYGECCPEKRQCADKMRARRPVLRGRVQVSPRRPVRGPIRLLPRRRRKEVSRPRNPEGVLLRGEECLLRRN